MNIEPAAGEREFIELVDLDELPKEQPLKFGGAGRAVLLYRSGAGVRAFRAYCTHHGLELMASGIQGVTVTCALHGRRLRMPDGDCLHGERWGLRELGVRINAGRVSLQWRD